MGIRDIQAAIEGILFASGDPISVERLAAVLGIDTQLVFDTAELMRTEYETSGRGIRLVRLENSLQLCSAPEYADYIRLALETGKQPRLTQPALEVLSIIAYFQPATRAYVEQVRGVDCTYTISLLQSRGLIEPRGRLAVPGRPVLYGTTSAFLRTFGLAALDELPELPVPSEHEEHQLVIDEDAKPQDSENDGVTAGENAL